jgi:Flp pilus assembly protein protease CpaA
MLGWVLLLVGIAGFGYAAYLDLKTTEFPDLLPYSLIISAIVIRAVFATITGNYNLITNSIIIGIIFLGFGFILYFLKQWGDGDAWLLGALGFLFPDASGFFYQSKLPFHMGLLFNFFFVSFFYLITYSIAIGVKENVGKKFLKEFKGELKSFLKILFLFSAAILSISLYLILKIQIDISGVYPLLTSPLILILLIVFVRYGKFLEKSVFRKKIHVSKLREGDVPVNKRWKVLTKEEVKQLKKRGGHIWIKEGVRFAPVFLITMLITLFYGVLFI